MSKHVGTAKYTSKAALQTNIRKVTEFFTRNKDLVSLMKKMAFSIATDGSNDIGAVKLYPVADGSNVWTCQAVPCSCPYLRYYSGRLLSVKECEKNGINESKYPIWLLVIDAV